MKLPFAARLLAVGMLTAASAILPLSVAHAQTTEKPKVALLAALAPAPAMVPPVARMTTLASFCCCSASLAETPVGNSSIRARALGTKLWNIVFNFYFSCYDSA